MQRVMLSVAVLLMLPVVASAGASTQSVTPTQKVITLLQGMIEKGKQEKHQEEVAYADLKVFCDDHITQAKRTIKQEDDRVLKLTADANKLNADASAMAKRIRSDESVKSSAEQDVQASTKIRAQEHQDYQTTHKDYTESIDALSRAIAVMQKQTHSRSQASFAQLASLQTMNLIPVDSKKKIDLFLMQDPEDEGLAIAAPEANAYEFQGSHIIEMLEKLLDKFIEEKNSIGEERGKHETCS